LGKKLTQVFILLTILLTAQVIQNIKEDSTVELTYRITKSQLIAHVDENSLKTNKFNFDWHYFPEGTKITVLINYDEAGMNADFILDNLTDDFVYSIDALKIIVFNHLVHTYRLSYALTMYWNDLGELADGYSLYFYPYFTPGLSTWNYFTAIGEEYRIFYEDLASQGHDVSCDYATKTTSDKFIFEFWNGGNFTGKYKTVVIDSGFDNPISISYDNLFKIVINKNTGFIEGFHIKGRTLGTLNQSHFNVLLDYQYDKIGSSMSGFTLGTNFIVDPYLGRKIGVISGLLIILSLTISLPLFIRKRRKRINNKTILNNSQ